MNWQLFSRRSGENEEGMQIAFTLGSGVKGLNRAMEERRSHNQSFGFWENSLLFYISLFLLFLS